MEVLLGGKINAEGLYVFDKFCLQHKGDKVSNSQPHKLNLSTIAHLKNPDQVFVSAKSCTSFSLWHHKLGHPSFVVVNKVFSTCNLAASTHYFISPCNACMQGKAHRLPYPTSAIVYTKPLELIFSELWGPAPISSSNGNCYYVIFVDTYSKFTWIFPLKFKYDALATFVIFKKLVENQLDTSIKLVQTDWGGEFRSFTNSLRDNGIIHRLICLHAHPQNGTVERKHHHIVEMERTLLAQASMPLKFWEDAFVTSVFLINRLPSIASKDDTTPLQKLFSTIPDYSFLKVFGCLCYPLLRPFNKHKLYFWSNECVFLGYSPQHRGYKCLHPNGRIYVSRDVQFNESRFPYKFLYLLLLYILYLVLHLHLHLLPFLHYLIMMSNMFYRIVFLDYLPLPASYLCLTLPLLILRL